jgi:hypothetical protein
VYEITAPKPGGFLFVNVERKVNSKQQYHSCFSAMASHPIMTAAACASNAAQSFYCQKPALFANLEQKSVFLFISLI